MVPLADIQAEVPGFLEILGLPEEPLGMFYAPVEPADGFSPQSAILPNVDLEAAGRSGLGRRPSPISPASSGSSGGPGSWANPPTSTKPASAAWGALSIWVF